MSAGYHDEDDVRDLMVATQGLIGGLIEQADREPTIGLQSGWANAGHAPGSCETAIVPTHCLRTVSQRSLSEPVTFLGALTHVAAGADLFDAAVTSVATGCLPGVGTGGTAPIVFNSANVQVSRARTENLVLWAQRAKIAVMLQTSDGGAINDINLGPVGRQLVDFMRSYVVERVFHTSDPGAPWIDDTPLWYFDRPDGKFVAVPPVLWRERDPYMELDVRTADFGAAANALPTLSLGSIDVDVQAGIMIESLWIPNPDQCGAYWPGQFCPREHVEGTTGYRGK